MSISTPRVTIGANELNSIAFGGPYVLLGYSEADFTRIVKELVQGRPFPPPNHSQPALKLDYFSPYTAMLQSSLSGKTRFLREPIKEDSDTRIMVIYFTCKSNIGEVGMQLITQIMNKLFEAGLSVTESFLETVYRQIQAELFDTKGMLKSEYFSCGGIDADEIWNKAQKLPPYEGDGNFYCETEHGKKSVIVAFAIDEAHWLLEEDFYDDPKFGFNLPPPPSKNSLGKRAREPTEDCDEELAAKRSVVDMAGTSQRYSSQIIFSAVIEAIDPMNISESSSSDKGTIQYSCINV
jgi:hypothetical protein